MHTSSHGGLNGATAMTLVGLEAMPCGCVAGVYQAPPSVLALELVEAKGPHCVFSGHRTGRITRVGAGDLHGADLGEPRA